MQGNIAQARALVVLGNDLLQGPGRKRSPRWNEEGGFVFCSTVDFAFGDDAAPSGASIALDPDAWIERLRAEGVIGLRLQHRSAPQAGLAEHESVAFVGGGGEWTVEAVGPRGSDLWTSRQKVADRDRVDRRIWKVRWTRAWRDVPHLPPPSARGDLAATHAAMRSVLQRIAAFAERAGGLDGFVGCFRRGLAALDSTAPFGEDRPGPPARDFAWLRLPLAARQVAAAADAAWVFGGMGSWNDIGFDGEAGREYDALTGELWRATIQAVLVSAEASFDASGRLRAGTTGTGRFVVSQEPGNVSTIDYGRLHAVAHDRDLQARDDGDGLVRLRIERFAGPVLVSLRPDEHDRLRALCLPTRPVQPPWCQDDPLEAALSVEPADGPDPWRLAYGAFSGRAAREALSIGTAGLLAFLVVDAVAEPVALSLPPGVAWLDAGAASYPWRETRALDPSAFERIGPNAARHRLEGWSVSRTGRYTMRYEAGPRAIEAEVDPAGAPAPGVPDLLLYRASLAGWMQPHHREPLADDERDRIAQRMAQACAFLGTTVRVE